MDNPKEMDTFLEEYTPLRLSQEEIVNLNRPVTRSEIESIILKKKLLADKSPGPNGFTGESYHTHKEEFTPILLKLLRKTEGEETLPKSFYEASVSMIPNQAKKRNLQAKCLNNIDAKLLHKIFIT